MSLAKNELGVPSVLISILNWNNNQLTRDCINSVLKQDYPNYSILVIDNDSDVDPISQIEEDFPSVKFIHSKTNLGYAGGHKLSVELAVESQYDLIWLLNNDVHIREENHLTNLVEAFLNKGLGLYGSMLGSKQPVQVWLTDGKKPLFDKYVDSSTLNKQINRVANLMGSSILIPLSVINDHGFMDSEFFLYGEETDYCFRLLKFGIPSYLVKDSKINHYSQGSTKKNPKLQKIVNYYIIRNHLILSRRHQSFQSFLRLSFNYLTFGLISILKREERNEFIIRSVWDSWIGRTGKTLRPEDYI